jgi:hypothetical protein
MQPSLQFTDRELFIKTLMETCFGSRMILKRVIVSTCGLCATARRPQRLLRTLHLERLVVARSFFKPLYELSSRELKQLDALEHARLKSHALLLAS